jgi:hypothetical protein
VRLQEIKTALAAGGKGVAGLTRLFPEARDQSKWVQIRQNPFYQEMLQELRAETKQMLQQPLPVLPYSLFRLFGETGSRQEYEAFYFSRRARLNDCALLALVDGEKRYLGALEDTIWAICDEYTWCLPAHLSDGTFGRVANPSLNFDDMGIVTGGQRPLEKMLDLFAAETGFALAEILSLLGPELAPEVVRRGRAEVVRRVLKPYQQLIPLLWWETATMNWAAVCAGSIGAAALYLIADEAVLAPVLHRVLETLELFLTGFGADGACTEGISYWTYGFGFYVYFASLLYDRTQGQIDLLRHTKIAVIAQFQQKCYLTQNYVVSFSDTDLTQNFQLGLTHFLKRRYPELQMPEARYRASFAADSGRRWAHAVRDLVWADPDLASGMPASGTEYLPDAQWFIAKHEYRGQLVCFAAKGGHNGEPHNHNDLGSFILHVGGETLLADLGRGEYTRQYFCEAERYQFLCTSSRGHSVPIIGAGYQKAGAKFAAARVTVATDPEADRMQLELAGAYGIPDLQTLRREFSWTKRDYSRLRLTDHFGFRPYPLPVTERFIAVYPPETLALGRVRVKGIHFYVDLVFDAQNLQYQVRQETMRTGSRRATTRTVYLLDLEVVSGRQEMVATVDFEIGCI